MATEWKFRILGVIVIPMFIIVSFMDMNSEISSNYLIAIFLTILYTSLILEALLIKKIKSQKIIYLSKLKDNSTREIVFSLIFIIIIFYFYQNNERVILLTFIIIYGIIKSLFIKPWDYIIEGEKLILNDRLVSTFNFKEVKSHYISHTGAFAISIKNKRNDLITKVSQENIAVLIAKIEEFKDEK